jgi:Fibrillar collagen C-terminal domain
MQQTVRRQNVQIEQLERQIVQLTAKSDERDLPLGEGKAVLYRSCEELRSVDPQSGSGGYWIDPDGVETGDPPIFVQCDMTTG